MDMIYEVNRVELGVNEVLQLIELIYGEGKYSHEILVQKVQAIFFFFFPPRPSEEYDSAPSQNYTV